MAGVVNGYANGASTGMPTPNVVAAAVTADHKQTDGNATQSLVPAGQAQTSLEVSRFMPVMNIDQALERREMIVQATAKLMKEGVDFGKIPGTDKPALLQPGADKLCNLFGIVIQYEQVKCIEDWTGDNAGGVPFFFYEIKGRAYRGDFLLGEGVGSCSSRESKYMYRKGERKCPSCGKANIRKSRDGGYYCWLKTDGCGATFQDGDQRIEAQQVGRVVNPDIADCVNTILKMAYKRAKLSATINATSASEFFTQDVEDFVPADDSDPQGRNIDIGDNQYGTQGAADYVRDQKLAQMPHARRQGQAAPQRPASEADLSPWRPGDQRGMVQAFERVRGLVPERVYSDRLAAVGVDHPAQIKMHKTQLACYRALLEDAARFADPHSNPTTYDHFDITEGRKQ